MYSEYHHGSIRQQLACTTVLVYIERDRQTDRLTRLHAFLRVSYRSGENISLCACIHVFMFVRQQTNAYSIFVFLLLESVVLV